MAGKFNENTRVQVPAILHLCRLGYTYLSHIVHYNDKTNILTDVFKRSVKKLNPLMADIEISQLLDKIVLMSTYDDLGRDFYQLLTANGGVKLIDFDNPANNEWHCTSEFTCHTLLLLMRIEILSLTGINTRLYKVKNFLIPR